MLPMSSNAVFVAIMLSPVAFANPLVRVNVERMGAKYIVSGAESLCSLELPIGQQRQARTPPSNDSAPETLRIPVPSVVRPSQAQPILLAPASSGCPTCQLAPSNGWIIRWIAYLFG